MNMKGFTLIEAMVAVTILTLAVAGPLYVADRSMVAAQIAQEQLTASYLAQEGIEYVRLMRDDEYLAYYQSDPGDASVDAWYNFIKGSDSASITNCVKNPSSTVFCTLDLSASLGMGFGPGFVLQQCTLGSSCTPLYLASTGVYNQSGIGTVTPFTRVIRVESLPGTTDPPGFAYPDKRVISTVSFNFHGTTYYVTITDHLTPWQ